MLTASCKETENPQIKLLVIAGELDSLDDNIISSRVKEEINKGNRFFVADVRDLTYVSSTGLLDLLSTKEMITKRGGAIAFHGFSQNITETLVILGILKVLHILPTYEECVSYLHSFVE